MSNESFDHFFVAPSDFDATLAFYAETLGWRVTSQWGDQRSGRGATMECGRVQIAIAEKHARDPHDESNMAMRGSAPTLYFAVDDLVQHFEPMKGKPCVVIPISKTHWGIDWYVIEDPDGNLIAFTQRS